MKANISQISALVFVLVVILSAVMWPAPKGRFTFEREPWFKTFSIAVLSWTLGLWLLQVSGLLAAGVVVCGAVVSTFYLRPRPDPILAALKPLEAAPAGAEIPQLRVVMPEAFNW
ncbi:MAG TPA: hypothetical protein VGP13_04215 [Candidatus Paceibacterota bacterium]|jgi:hypothetical protein|nr:hypothetical protein [Candidatus Paceibacterota bacterium]